MTFNLIVVVLVLEPEVVVAVVLVVMEILNERHLVIYRSIRYLMCTALTEETTNYVFLSLEREGVRERSLAL